MHRIPPPVPRFEDLDRRDEHRLFELDVDLIVCCAFRFHHHRAPTTAVIRVKRWLAYNSVCRRLTVNHSSFSRHVCYAADPLPNERISLHAKRRRRDH